MQTRLKLFLVLAGIVCQAHAQIVIPVPAFLKDGISSPTYDRLLKINGELSVFTASNLAALKAVELIVSEENLRLGMVAAIAPQHQAIKEFIQSDCTNYINKRYPISNPITGNSLKNLAIRNRFRRKFSLSIEQADHYFSKEVYVSEGQRILLSLMLVEDVLNLTLRNETY